MGAWIEMCDLETTVYKGQVAPLVGAWIEIMLEMWLNQTKKSLPSWERGLKYMKTFLVSALVLSLPSWERGLKLMTIYLFQFFECRSPRGSVD